MQIALWLAIAVLAIVWIVRPSAGRRPPVLLLVRNRGEEVEGVIRALRLTGHSVAALDLGSADDTPRILNQLALDGTARVDDGGVDEAIFAADAPAVLVLRLDERYGAAEALGKVDTGR